MSRNINQLSERSLHLFKLLVEYYIQDGQPVGSRTLARETDYELSPATIRNVMADLEDMGLIQSPHTSAGRVPTARGYRFFVDTLLRVDKLSQREVARIAAEIEAGEHDVRELMQRTSAMLSEITHLAGIVMLPRADHKSLQHVEFISLSDNRVLVILVMNDREVQNRIIHTARCYSPAELQYASNYLNNKLRGRDLHRVRDEILRELQQTKDDVTRIMQAAVEMAERMVAGDAGHGDYVLAGQTNLMDVAEFCDVEKLKRLFDTFNQKHDILHLLDQAIRAKGVQIFIGEESGYEVLDQCSVVTSPYGVSGEVVGVLGVIGPTRMPYDRVVPIVDVTARMLGTALNSHL
jgi:heat-inducible transcriptional repressor